MTDRPILFSGPMVNAILEGRKTQTRRVLKLPRQRDRRGGWEATTVGGHGVTYSDGTPAPEEVAIWHTQTGYTMVPPYAVGDRLWVREAWRVGAWHYNNSTVAIDYCDGPRKEWLDVDNSDLLLRLIDQSRSDAKKANQIRSGSYYEHTWSAGDGPCRWRPSIHMPRWASRLTLVVTDVRVQRLNEISGADCVAEGIEVVNKCFGETKDAFHKLWDSINDARGHGWGANPWVVAVTFETHKCNIDHMEPKK